LAWWAGTDAVRIVGVVENVVQRRQRKDSQPAIYLPYAQFSPMAGVQAAVRTTLPTDVVLLDVARVAAQFNGA
jgi:hypothetical protein